MTNASCVPAPTVDVAVNVTGLPFGPVAVALSVYGCAVAPSVHDVSAAMPEAFVVTVERVPASSCPLRDLRAGRHRLNVTTTPATGLPALSVTSTDGGIGTAVLTVAV